MAKEIPEKFKYFLKNAVSDCEDGYEYASELNRILNSDECQTNFTSKEIEALRDFADQVKKMGEFNSYSADKIRDIEIDMFGNQRILGYLGISSEETKPVWPF
jgi:predicted house-cleaning noncanonical NTP pyrophosphatase (MazG superfamily)